MWNKVGTKQGAESASVSHPPSIPSSASHWLPCPQDLISCGQHCYAGACVGQRGDGEGSRRGSDHENNTGLCWAPLVWGALGTKGDRAFLVNTRGQCPSCSPPLTGQSSILSLALP